MPKSILIVDDCPTTRKLILLYLRPSGHRVLQAENGLDALEKLTQGPVALIITDMNMPQMDGVELTTVIKHDVRLCSIPVLMLTTERAEEERQHGIDAGVAGYLTKPISREGLVAEVNTLLADRHTTG